MLKNKIIAKKIRNILILFMALIIMLGAYKNIRDSRAESVIEIEAVALDNYGISDNEEFVLEAREIESENEDIYEIEIPEEINEKIINEIISITIDTSSEPIEVNDNKIQLTKEQIENGKISFNVKYESAVLVITDEGQYTKELLSEKTEEEIQELIENGEETVLIYKKTLKYEDEENKKLVQITGYLPENTRLEIEEKTADQLTGVFEDVGVSTAYDIVLCRDITTKIPIETSSEEGTEEENAEIKYEEYTETIAINPLDYGESVEILINDQRITENSGIYIVDENNTFDQLEIIEKTNGSAKVKGYFNGVYTITDAETQSVEFSTPIGGSGDQATTDGTTMTAHSTTTPELINYFAPASGTWSFEVNDSPKNVKIWFHKLVNGRNIEYIAWTDATTMPTSWNSASSMIKGSNDYSMKYVYLPETVGTWYLHVKDSDGYVYYSGAYVVSNRGDYGGAGNVITAEVTGTNSSNGYNPTDVTLRVDAGSGKTFASNPAILANWFKTDGYTWWLIPSADDSLTKYEGTSGNRYFEKTFTTPWSEDGKTEGYYALRYKYYGKNSYGTATVYDHSKEIYAFDYKGPDVEIDEFMGDMGTPSGWQNKDIYLNVWAHDRIVWCL